MEYHTIIIGAGAAGLFAGATAGKSNKTLIIEKKANAGMKLLMSGSGRCNITNSKPIPEFYHHYNQASINFIKSPLNSFSNIDLLAFLHANSVQTVEANNGKIFPKSQSSREVLDLFLRLCRKNRVDIVYSETVQSAVRVDELFIVETDKYKYSCKYLIVASGGKSYPVTGSVGDGYHIAKSFLHTIETPKPALTPILYSNFYFKSISGVSVEAVRIMLYRNGKKVKEHIGDVLFTHRGLSGPGILDFSRYFELGDVLRINWSGKTFEELNTDWLASADTQGFIQVKTLLKRLDLPEALINAILDKNLMLAGKKLSEISKANRKKILSDFSACEFPIEKIGDFNVALTTTGGVRLREINPKNMMSKLCTNLFFVGEVLDIDADTGGYSLQSAFSTSASAIRYIKSVSN